MKVELIRFLQAQIKSTVTRLSPREIKGNLELAEQTLELNKLMKSITKKLKKMENYDSN